MSARVRGKVVSRVVYDLTGEGADIRLLTKPLRFYAEVLDGGQTKSFEDKDGDAVAQWALDALKRNAVTEWRPVIEIFLDEDGRFTTTKEALVVDFRRFHLGGKVGSWRMVPWEDFDGENPARMAHSITELVLKDSACYRGTMRPDDFDGSLPYHTHGVDPKFRRWVTDPEDQRTYLATAKRGVVFAYDSATWSALGEIAATIRRAREKLNELVAAPQTLATFSGGLVPRRLLAIERTGE